MCCPQETPSQKISTVLARILYANWQPQCYQYPSYVFTYTHMHTCVHTHILHKHRDTLLVKYPVSNYAGLPLPRIIDNSISTGLFFISKKLNFITYARDWMDPHFLGSLHAEPDCSAGMWPLDPTTQYVITKPLFWEFHYKRTTHLLGMNTCQNAFFHNQGCSFYCD